MSRRQFLVMVGAAGAALAGYSVVARAAPGGGTIAITEVRPGEDVFAYISRIQGGFDQSFYQQLIWQTTDQAQYAKVQDWTMGQLKEILLTASEPD